MKEELMRQNTGIPGDRNNMGEDSSICIGDNMWRESAAGVDEKENRQSKWIKNGMSILSGTLIDLFLNSMDTWGELDKYD